MASTISKFPFWLGVDPTTGTGPGTSNISVRANDGRDRECTLTITGTVNGNIVTSTALVHQAGEYKPLLTNDVKVTSEGATVTPTTTSVSGVTYYTINNNTWKSKSEFTFEIKTNAAAYNINLIPSITGVIFNTSGQNTITYTDDSGTSTTTSLGEFTSSTTSIDTRTILPGFDPGINGVYTINFSVRPQQFTNTSSRDVFCGVRLYALEDLKSSPTLVAQLGTNYPGVTGLTPSFPGGGSSVTLGSNSTSTTLEIDCAEGVEWSIS